jgi:hypothetical protein
MTLRLTNLVIFTASLALPSYSQTITGSISGRIVDQQGGAVPNATVTVTESAKAINVATKSGAGGEFSVAGLLPGNCGIAVEAAGFKKLSRTDVPLNANDKLVVGDLALDVGAVTESVEVTATAALLQTESVELRDYYGPAGGEHRGQWTERSGYGQIGSGSFVQYGREFRRGQLGHWRKQLIRERRPPFAKPAFPQWNRKRRYRQ